MKGERKEEKPKTFSEIVHKSFIGGISGAMAMTI